MEIIERWKTETGLDAICALVCGAHLCGYVKIPETHILHNVDYCEKSPAFFIEYQKILESPTGKRGVLECLTADKKIPRPCDLFDVHGSLTFSGKLPGIDGFWYGFDCAHYGDSTAWTSCGEKRTPGYVHEECESLAQQIISLKGG